MCMVYNSFTLILIDEIIWLITHLFNLKPINVNMVPTS